MAKTISTEGTEIIFLLQGATGGQATLNKNAWQENNNPDHAVNLFPVFQMPRQALTNIKHSYKNVHKTNCMHLQITGLTRISAL
jgi:hypothetical protein